MMNRRSSVLLLLCALLFMVSVVEAKDAVIAYRSDVAGATLCTQGGVNNATYCPRIRFWNSTGTGTWGPEIELQSGDDEISAVVVRASPYNNKLVVVSVGTDDYLDTYVCTTNCTDRINWQHNKHVASVVDYDNIRRFDFNFETATGDLVLVYSINNTDATRDFAYMVLPVGSTNFTGISEQYIDDTFNSGDPDFTWVAMDRSKNHYSEELALTAFDYTNKTSYAWIWNGNSWGNEALISSSLTEADNHEAIAVRYTNITNKAMVIGANGTKGDVVWRYWNGSSWSGFSKFDATSGNFNVHWASLKSDPSSDYLQAIFIDDGGSKRLDTAFWNGSSWSVTQNIDNNIGSNIDNRAADFEWNSGSTGLLIWDANVAGRIYWMNCAPECTAGSNYNMGFGGNGRFITTARNPNQTDYVKILGIRLNNAGNGEMGSFGWNDSAINNYGDTVITPSTGTQNVNVAFSLEGSSYFDLVSPKVYLVAPANNSFINIPHNLTFNVSDEDSWKFNCSLYINNSLVQTNSSTAVNTNTNFLVSGLVGGNYSWYVKCTDQAGNNGTSDTWYFNAEDPPVVTIYSPLNTTYNTNSVDVNFTATDTNLDTCWVSCDGGSASYGCANTTCGSLSNGGHYVTVSANDTTGNINSSTVYFTVDNCPIINSSGTHTMAVDYIGAPNNASPLSVAACVKITASDVVFDCNGHSMTNNVFIGTTYGVLLNGSLTNVTVKNCPSISTYSYGVYELYSTYSVFTNITAVNSITAGFRLEGSHFNTLSSNNASGSLNGFDLRYSNNNTLTTSSAYGNTYGIYLWNSSNNTLSDNDANDNGQYGFLLVTYTDYNTLSNNEANGNYKEGFYFSYADYNLLSNNNASSNTGHGFDLEASQYNTLNNNLAFNNNKSGYFLTHDPSVYSDYNTLSNNIASSNKRHGFRFESCDYTALNNNLAFNNSETGFDLDYTCSFNNLTDNTASYNHEGFVVNDYSDFNTFLNNTANNNTGDGFNIFYGEAMPYGNVLIRNTAFSNNAGFNLTLAEYTNLSGNTAYSNTVAGVLFFFANHTRMEGDHLYNNGHDLVVNDESILNLSYVIFDNTQGGFVNFTNLTINDDVESGAGYFVDWSAQPPGLSPGYTSLGGKFVNISALSGSLNIANVIWYYTAAEAGSEEPILAMYNGTWDYTVNTTPDTTNHILSLSDVSVNGDYAVLIVSHIPPEIYLVSPLNGSFLNTPTVNFTFYAVDDLSTVMNCSLYGDGSLKIYNESTQNNTNTTFTMFGIPEGLHTWNVNCTDSNMNSNVSETWEFTVDLTAPSLTVESPTGVSNTSTPDLNYTTDADNCSYSVDGGAPIILPGCSNITLPTLGDGSHNVTVIVNDTAGNTNSSTVYFIVDTTQPVVTIQSPLPKIYNITSIDLNYTASDANIDTCWYVLDSSPAVYPISCSNDTLSALADGDHNVTVYANDTAGNTASATQYFSVDTVPPTLTVESPVTAPPYTTATPPLNYTTDAANCSYSLDGGALVSLPGCTNITLPTLTNGDHNVTVVVTDTAGNQNSSTVTFSVSLGGGGGGGGGGTKGMILQYRFVCPGDLVVFNVTSVNKPLNGVSIRVIYQDPPYDVVDLTTGPDGLVSISLPNGTFKARAMKTGYTTKEENFGFTTCPLEAQCSVSADCSSPNDECVGGQCMPISCACGTIKDHSCEMGCCSDSQCPAGQTCQEDHTCKPQYECTSNETCADTQYCDIPEGQAGGTCKDVPGRCGYAANHAWVSYACGTPEEGCNACANGGQCENHACYLRDVTAKEDNYLGDNVTVHCSENQGPYRNCVLTITLPDGSVVSATGDGNGNYLLSLDQLGAYSITLVSNGRTITVNSLPVPAAPEKPGIALWDYCLPALLLLLLLLILFFLWKRRKKEKEPPKPQARR